MAGGLVTGLVLFALAPTVLGLIGGGTGLDGPGAVYLRILAVAVPLVAATFTLQGVYAGLGATRVTMALTLLVNAVNLPVGVLLGLGYGIEVALVARLGAVPVAANRLIENLALVSFTALVACGTGVTVLAGQRLGAGDPEGAAAYRAAGMRLSVLLAGVPLVPLLVVPELVFGLFSPDPQVVAAASSVALLAVVALVPLVFSLNLGGVLRAAGDTRTVLVASLAGDAFLVPLAWLLGIALGLGLGGLMLAWVAYGLVFVAVAWWRYHTGSWRTSIV